METGALFVGQGDSDDERTALGCTARSRTGAGMTALWQVSDRADVDAVRIADRHYNRQKVGTPQFVPPGRCVVFKHERAVWVTSWPFAEYVKHAWPGAWVNSVFRNEGAGLSSDLITQAVALTRAVWEPPSLGIVTFVDAGKVRHKRDPGRCYRKAGWRHVGFTQGGLWVFQQLPSEMPAPDYSLASPLLESA
jgi:hypothetical protein